MKKHSRALHPPNLPAEHVNQTLQTHTNAKHGYSTHEILDGILRDPRVRQGVSRSRGDDQVLDVEFWKVFRGDSIVSDDRDRDTKEAYVLVEVPGEGVEVVDQEHFDRDREFGREGPLRFSAPFDSGCGRRLSRFWSRLRHNSGKKTRAMVSDGIQSGI